MATRFYDHLKSLKDIAQFVVIKNQDVTGYFDGSLPVETFTATENFGRYGFFPEADWLGRRGLEHMVVGKFASFRLPYLEAATLKRSRRFDVCGCYPCVQHLLFNSCGP